VGNTESKSVVVTRTYPRLTEGKKPVLLEEEIEIEYVIVTTEEQAPLEIELHEIYVIRGGKRISVEEWDSVELLIGSLANVKKEALKKAYENYKEENREQSFIPKFLSRMGKKFRVA